MTIDLLESLLYTKALNFPPPEEVFWYTSGTVGPYYINTHFLYGSQEEAEELLEMINIEKDNPEFPLLLKERVDRQYMENSIYRYVIDSLVDLIRYKSSIEFDAISGGERRDWFFSLAVAQRLGKPHLFIFKDLKKVILKGADIGREGIKGINTLHVADLVTEASSYFRSWIPALNADSGIITYSVNVIDRGQGGVKALREKGVACDALLSVDNSLFSKLLTRGTINADQAKLFEAYQNDPYVSMRDFLLMHPDFVELSLSNDDPKIRQRAKLFLENDPYKMR